MSLRRWLKAQLPNYEQSVLFIIEREINQMKLQDMIDVWLVDRLA